MRNPELIRQLQRLKGLIGRTTAASAGDLEIQAHWAKYLCVLAAGFLENAISEIYADFVRNSASEPVANYTCRVLVQIQNPKTSKFIETARLFKESWAEALEIFVAQDGRSDAINSIMSNRHLIAHGKDSGITIVRLREWLEKSVEVIDFIESQCRK